MSRKMAYVVAIDSVHPIDGADAIEVARTGGWAVVTKRGEFQPGDLAAYFEIDAFLPEGNPAWQFLVDKSARPFENLRGHVLRTVKLRGQVSQGLLISLPLLGIAAPALGQDLSEVLGVLKYERPIPVELAGIARGEFPSRVPRTDQERIQNLAVELALWQQEKHNWEVTEKLEGTSCTFAWLGGELHVCSRNIDLLDTQDNTLWKMARALEIEAKMTSYASEKNLALQGEMIGHGVQGNHYERKGQEFYLYDIYDVDRSCYLPPAERQEFAERLGVAHVPIVQAAMELAADNTMAALLDMADGQSSIASKKLREGLVFKRSDGGASFKAVSNRYLLKQND